MNHPFDFGEGVVVYCSWEIDETKPLSRQLWELRQDLIQVHFAQQKLTLDLGWYPDFNPEGWFLVFVVRNENWEEPVVRREAFTLAELKVCVAELVQTIANNS